MSDVDQIVATIAAVEEQSVTTRDIAGNVGQASQGVQEVNENMSHADVVIREIAGSVEEVNFRIRRSRQDGRFGPIQFRDFE